MTEELPIDVSGSRAPLPGPDCSEEGRFLARLGQRMREDIMSALPRQVGPAGGSLSGST